MVRVLKNSLTEHIFEIIICSIVLILYASTLAPTITWQNGGSDGAELALAVAEPGIAHTPGYPTYIVLSHLWLKLSIGKDIAHRLNMSSMIWTVFGIYILMRVSRNLLKKHHCHHRSYLISGLILASAPLIWSQAIITEVYAMGLGFLSIMLFVFFKFLEHHNKYLIFLLGLVLGLVYGVVPALLLAFIPIALSIITLSQSIRSKVIFFLLLNFGCLVGLSIFLYLPLRSISEPIANWGRPQTAEQLGWMISGAQYHQFVRVESLSNLVNALFEASYVLVQNLHFWGLFPAVLGAYWVYKHEKQMFIVLSMIFIFSVLHTVIYQVDNHIVYLFPAVCVQSLCLGIGLAYIGNQLKSIYHQRLIFFTLFIFVGAHVAVWYHDINLSNDYTALEFAQETLESPPQTTVIVSHTDETTFALWYGQKVFDRKDIIVIDSRLLLYDWYVENLHVQYPNLDVRWLRPGGLTGLPNPIYDVERDSSSYILVPIQ